MPKIMLERSGNVKYFFNRPMKYPYPLDLDHQRRYTERRPKRLLRRVTVTVAAGFKCSDGIVLATDLEITGGMLKWSGGKSIFTSNAGINIGIVGAGDYGLLAYACEMLPVNAIGETCEEVAETVQKNLSRLFRDHIRIAWPKEEWSTALQLIVGITVKRPKYENEALYKSERSVLHKISPYGFVGAGGELASYIVGKLRKEKEIFPKTPDLSDPNPLEELFESPAINKCVPIAREVIREVGENVAYCGRESNVLKIPCDGEPSYEKG